MQHIPEDADEEKSSIDISIQQFTEAKPVQSSKRHDIGEGFRWFVGYVVIITAVLIALGWHSMAHAQTPCTVGGSATCFVASKTVGESPLATTLTWNVVGASACTAGNTPGWTGAVPTSGTRSMSGITTRMTLTLDCTAPATGGKMRVTWTPPTQNTDNTPAQLGGYYIDFGTAPGALNQTINLAVPGASAYDITGLAAGTWYASLRAATPSCFPTTTAGCYVSVSSSVASKAVTTTPGGALPQLSVALEPFQVPKPPTNIVATDVTAFAVGENPDGTLIATPVALVPVSTTCAADRCTVLARRQ